MDYCSFRSIADVPSPVLVCNSKYMG
jgi:hypothetical protein